MTQESKNTEKGPIIADFLIGEGCLVRGGVDRNYSDRWGGADDDSLGCHLVVVSS